MAVDFDVSQYSALSRGGGARTSGDGGTAGALPGLAIEWRSLRYAVPAPAGQGASSAKVVLDGVSGRALPGEVFAILGPSGSGKTSLLNALAGRTPAAPKGSRLEGDIRVGAKGEAMLPVTRLDVPSVTAYVEQDDALFALSTVRETLSFVARLRLPQAVDRAHRVDAAISRLGLLPAADTVIGSDRPGQRGISGGERKRVNIGCELIHQPRIVFLDEPTSGLDSFQAMHVMQTLKALAQQGHTVVVTIHQPRSSIYQLFDQVMLMAEGRVVYCGTTGSACSAFFAAAGHAVPANFNPADHFLDVISLDCRNQEELQKSRARLARLCDRASAEGVGGGLAAPPPPSPPRNAALPWHLHPRVRPSKAPLCVQFDLLFRRAWREVMRDVVALGFKMFMQLFFTLIFGCVYFRMDMSQTSLQNRTGILFFMAMNQASGGVIGTASVIPRQLKVVQRDRAAKLYDMLPFYFASMITQIPLETLPGFVWGMIIYNMTSLRPGFQHMCTYCLILMVENLTGISFGMVISASVSSVEMAPQVAPACVILFLMFSGFLLNQDSIPAVFAPLKHISFIRYSFQALAANELKDNDGFECKDRIFGPRCMQGDDWLKQLGFEDVSISHNICIMVFEALIFHALALVILVSKKPSFLRPQKPRDYALGA
uniref:ABC transporter domain-containing protein n=1 Tax=Zooxanthella nutricula TaxID=1333877 RepID=A0A7S2QCP9_9DINO